MAKKQLKLKIWFDNHPKVRSAVYTFLAGFVGTLLIQLNTVEWDSLGYMVESGAIMGIFMAAVRAALIAGLNALGSWLATWLGTMFGK